MLRAKLRNRTFQGLDRQGPGQGQGLDLQGQGQGLTSLGLLQTARVLAFESQNCLARPQAW